MYGNNGSVGMNSGSIGIDADAAVSILNSAVSGVNELISYQQQYEDAVGEMITGWSGGGKDPNTSRLYKALTSAQRAHAGAVAMIAFYQQFIDAIIDTGNALWGAANTGEQLFQQN